MARDDNVLRAEWYTEFPEKGYLKLDMDQFFPCTVPRLKKVLKIIRLDYKNREAVIEKLKNYFQKRIEELPIERQSHELSYNRELRTMAACEQRVHTGKHPDGTPPTQDEKTFWKESRTKSRANAAQYQRDMKADMRDLAWFKKNIALIQ